MSDYFPKIFLPSSLTEFYKDWRNNIDKHIEPTKPVEPSKPEVPEKEKYELIAILGMYLFVGFILFAFFKSIQIVISGGTVWTIFYTVYYFLTVVKYKKKQKVYNIESTKYKQDLLSYEIRVFEYSEELALVKKRKEDIYWLEQKRLEVTNSLMKPLKTAEIGFSSRKGVSENNFANTLDHFFGNLISTDKTIEIFRNYQNDSNYEFQELNGIKLDTAYVPDFIFTHDKSNMVIDIEIDEPYTYNEPIHTKEDEKDEKRNNYFTLKNWFVIRFSERQIVKHPESCCKEIALLIQDYTGDSSFLNKIGINNVVPRDKAWTYSIAKDYAINKVRKNYSALIDEKIDEKLILGEWTCKGNDYLINSDQTIIETNKLYIGETDKGYFKLKTHPCGRLVMTVQWKNSLTKYFLNHSCDQELLLTDLYNREQITFQRK